MFAGTLSAHESLIVANQHEICGGTTTRVIFIPMGSFLLRKKKTSVEVFSQLARRGLADLLGRNHDDGIAGLAGAAGIAGSTGSTRVAGVTRAAGCACCARVAG